MSELRRIEDKIDHLHEMLHNMASTLADVARAVVPGSISPEDHAAILKRLIDHAARLESIAANVTPGSFRSLSGGHSMAISADLQAALDLVDRDTDAVAATVKSLDALISTSMTQADVDKVKATLAAVATRLEATAADPNIPVPPGPPPAPVAP